MRPHPHHVCAIFFVLLVGAGRACGSPPLHAEIDRLIDTGAAVPAARRSSDAEFLRRVFLDFAGRIPTATEARAFLADTAPDKRQTVIDRLLSGPDYSRRMADAIHVVLMERRGEHAEWRQFLRASFEQNKPLDVLVREILAPDADSEITRGSAYFLTNRLDKIGQNTIDYPGLARDIGRLFLGVDLQCAQCHDHLFVDDYKQADFQGLFAFVNHLSIRRDVKFPAVGEGLVKEKVQFASVFEQQPMATAPRLPGDDAEVEIPKFASGEEYIKPGNKATGFPGVPRFSPLAALGERLPRTDNLQFTRNAVNRLWFLMMGRGLVHPLDMHHGDNPPSHPQLLELLANEFAAHACDVRWLLRELALTETYQRSTLLPEGVEPDAVRPESFRVALERPLAAEQLLGAMLDATGMTERVLGAGAAAYDAADSPKLRKLRTRFVTAFGNAPAEPEEGFAPSLKSALFLLNDRTVLEWLDPQPGNLIDRLVQLSSPDEIAEELYLSVLTRTPTEDERAETAALLAGRHIERTQNIRLLVWALLASSEFCLNH